MLKCTVCGFEAHYLASHILEAHDMSPEEYEGPLASPTLEAAYESANKGRRRAPYKAQQALTVEFAGVEHPVNTTVPASACLQYPEGYRTPTRGKLAAAIRSISARVAYGEAKAIWVWGPPGTGKDAVFAAISATTRRPAKVFNIAPDVDITSWIETRAFDREKTYWEEGPLLKALRDGYTTPDGTVVPYLIVLSDLDRATRGQMEPLRAILDSLGGRIQSSSGMHKVLPGTLIVATANTAGGGDPSGRYSATVVDTSIMDRFPFRVKTANFDPVDEEPALRAKYPALCARFPELLPACMRVIGAIREAATKEEIAVDFGHRTACNMLSAMQVEAMAFPKVTDWAKIFRGGFGDILAGAPNEETAEAIKRIADPHVKNGVLDQGDTSHITSSPLGM